jgi:lipoprotein-releasing system permease protein
LLIGTDLASDLGVDIADKVRLQVAEGFALVFTVRGIFDLGNRGANKQSVFLTLKNAQALLHIAGAVTSLEVNVEDVDQAQIIAETITQFANVQANSWIKTSAQFFTAIQAQTTANVAIRFFVGLAVALGIASVLVVSVVQRSREIGILRAMGISRAQVLRVFLLQGALLGLGGSILGCLIGTGALLLWQSLMRNPDGTPMVQLFLNTTLFLSTFALGSLTGLGAAVTPAIRASRLDPATAIRA